uniref:Peptidase S1 domain-containing protein n=1 Tax=Pelodiscus sinensis TaxID=13735 RepID=K7F391_PELSI
VQFVLLLSTAFLLSPGAQAGEIVGGWEARPHSRPYMAYLYIKDGEEPLHCGGFLVAMCPPPPNGSCIALGVCSNIFVVLGAHNISQGELNRQDISVDRKIPHEGYNKDTLKNDIMLLQLKEEATLNELVGTITLPHANERVEPGTLCSVAGGGTVWPDGASYRGTLQEVDVVVMPDAACPRNPDWLYRLYDPATMMCVGWGMEGPKQRPGELSEGDSGGPLVCGGTAQGIVSWGPDKAPGVYTKISTFIPWIKKTMRTLQPGYEAPNSRVSRQEP